MYTSDTTIDSRKANRVSAVAFLGACAFCGFFSSVYAKYSHGVSSDYMTFICLIPFIGGVLPYTLLYVFKQAAPTGIVKQLYNWGVITITVGFLLCGIVEISGYEITTVSVLGMSIKYALVYFVAGAVLMAMAIAFYIGKRFAK